LRLTLCRGFCLEERVETALSDIPNGSASSMTVASPRASRLAWVFEYSRWFILP
jgi:hypothetical protein